MKKVLWIVWVFLSVIIISISFSFSIKEEVSYINKQPKKYFNIIKFEIKNEEIYLALNDKKKIIYNLETDGNYIEELTFKSDNTNVATVNQDGYVLAVGLGETNIIVKIKDSVKNVKVVVTDLINIVPNEWNRKKELLGCEIYSKEENDLLDKILLNRVKEAGYKTRAGVLEAARFITLEFPYKISYFSENGRFSKTQPTYYVDAEGRYYHKGLYLHKSRFKNINETMYGPSIWGCKLYSTPSKGERQNGLDCSGYIAWILLNGGFDPGDLGAGVTRGYDDFTDLGEKKDVLESIKNKNIKAGDLLSGPGEDGGHIAMVMGIKNNKYYVTESLWGNGDFGVIVRTYTKDNIKNYFKWHINMDSYYKNDGNYTEFWK